jgi:TRAP-type C4-dicarboxylate transport system permease small subunit
MLLKINDRLNQALSAITAVVLIAMMVHITLHALLRFFFSAPIYGTNEMVQFWYLPLVALLGIPAAQLQRQHITVTLATERMRFWNAAIFKMFAAVLGAILSGLWAWFGFQEALDRMAMGATAGVTDIVVWPVYFLVPLTFGLLAALYVVEIVAIRRLDDPEAALVTNVASETEVISK